MLKPTISKSGGFAPKPSELSDPATWEDIEDVEEIIVKLVDEIKRQKACIEFIDNVLLMSGVIRRVS